MSGFDKIEKQDADTISARAPSMLTIIDGASCWSGFQSLSDAVRFREASVSSGALIEMPEDEKTEEDRLVLLGASLRDLLIDPCREIQYEHMLTGQDFSLTRPFFGMEAAIALTAQCLLVAEGQTSWEAKSGEITRGDRALPHAWLENSEGRIFDICADRIVISPIITFTRDEPLIWQYGNGQEIEDPAARCLSEKLHDKIDSDLLDLLRLRLKEMRQEEDMPQP